VKRALVILSCLVASAHADPAERCTAGLAFAKRGDLPRAALYLEACKQATLAPDVAEQAARATSDVARKLEASKLSLMSISTSPDGMIGETDALPGERFTTPATVWAKAGTYKISVAADAASLGTPAAITVAKSIDAHSRTTVIINAPAAKKPARAGTVSFEEPEPAHEGPPPAVKHGTMMPKKYEHPGVASGPQIDDPFPTGVIGEQRVTWRLGARVGGGVIARPDADPQFGFALAAMAARSLVGPAVLTGRLDWTHGALDSIGVNFGVGLVVVERETFALSIGAALRGEVRVQDTLDMMPVRRFGGGGALDVDVAWLRLPLATALRLDQGFTEVVPGARSTALLLEVGYDFR